MKPTTKNIGRLAATLKDTSADTGAPHGSFEAFLSVPTLDRDEEVLDPFCFATTDYPLPDHITIDVDHAMSVEKTVASGTPEYLPDGRLYFRGTYASHPLAQMTRSLVAEGHIRTMSVAYAFGRYEIDPKDGKRHLRSGELLNAGIVAVSSNREAVITAAKAYAAAVDEAAPDAELKSIVGSYENLTGTLRDALRNTYPAAEYVWVRATFPDSVVVELEIENPMGGYTCQTLQLPYTLDAAGIPTFGDPTPVRLAEVVVPAKDASNAAPEGKAAAEQAAATPPAPPAGYAQARATLAIAHLALAE